MILSPRVILILLTVLVTMAVCETSYAATASSQNPNFNQSNLSVELHKFEIKKEYDLDGSGISRILVTEPDVVEIISQTNDRVQFKGVHIGSTLVLIWDEGGSRSIRLEVTQTEEVLEKRKERRREFSAYHQSIRNRSFKFDWEVDGSLVRIGKQFPKVNETGKWYNSGLKFAGHVPHVGNINGRALWEYRKNTTMTESEVRARDFKMVVRDTPIKLIQKTNVVLGANHFSNHDFVLPTTRIEGVTLYPANPKEITNEVETTVEVMPEHAQNPKDYESILKEYEKQLQQFEQGIYEAREAVTKPIASHSDMEQSERIIDESAIHENIQYSFILGRERDGGDIDSAVGTINRKLKDKMMAAQIDYFPIENMKISGMSARRWSGPKNGQSDRNYGLTWLLRKKSHELVASLGRDDLDHHAMHAAVGTENDWMALQSSWRNINKNYQTVSGSVSNQGILGWDMSYQSQPFKPLNGYEDFHWDLSMNVYRDRLSVNPNLPNEYNRTFDTSFSWKLPHEYEITGSGGYRNYSGLSFPYKLKKAGMGISKPFQINSWIHSVRSKAGLNYDVYSDAEESPGFNASRLEFYAGTSVAFEGGMWATADYRKIYLDEKEPDFMPAHSRPSEWVFAAGQSMALWDLPAQMRLSTRFALRDNVFGKTQEQITGENRWGIDWGLDWRSPSGKTYYIQTTWDEIRPLSDEEESAEFTVIAGMRMNWDSGLFFKENAIIYGHFFIDKNNNRRMDEGEVPLENMSVTTSRGQQVLTDENGFFRLRVKEGDITVNATQDIPEGYSFTTASYKDLELFPKDEKEVNFGIGTKLQFKGRIYHDVNLNNKYDKGDVGLSGVRAFLDSGQSVKAKAQGLYSFLKLAPGPNKLNLDISSFPAGYKSMAPISKEMILKAGQTHEYDIAFKAVRVFSGRVFHDYDNDGNFTDGDEPLKGVYVVFQGQEYKTNKSGVYRIRRAQPSDSKSQVILKDEHVPEQSRISSKPIFIQVPVGPIARENLNIVIQTDNITDTTL